jgi:NADH-quinone oxidoreductase subunit L
MDQAWLIPAIPGAIFVVLVFLGAYLPRGGDWLATGGMIVALVLAVMVTADLTNADPASLPIISGVDWIELPGVHVRLGFAVDEITVIMLVVVSFVAVLVMIYSTGYMHGEERYGWYYAVLSLFVASMLTLVLADNLLLMYITWEGVGVCSFLLIGFYHERRSAAEAAKKAFITTRIGDVGFLIGIILFWKATGTFDIQEIIHQVEEGGAMSDTYLTTATLFLFLGAVGKSAQFPLHVWLPDAMEGPTPVSALIHAATMVVAGVYLVARMLPVFEAAPGALEVVTVIALITTLMSATMGITATDIKRVVAYSTINSLGLMFLSLGAASVAGAMFYLFVHGAFKALLFLGCGSVIHGTEKQDVRELGGLWRKMPVTTWTFLVGMLAMAGLIPLSGFWAKDEILHALQHNNPVVYGVTLLSLVVTAFYMGRLFLLTFTGEPRDHHAYDHAHESGWVMAAPLVILAAITLVAGFVAFDQVGEALGFVGGIGSFLGEAPEGFHFEAGLALMSASLVLLGLFLAWYFYWGRANERAEAAGRFAPDLYQLWNNRYYMDSLYQAIIDRVFLGAGRVVAWFDRQVVNDSGVDGTAMITRYTGYLLKFGQTGKIPNYALAIVVGAIGLALLALTTRL